MLRLCWCAILMLLTTSCSRPATPSPTDVADLVEKGIRATLTAQSPTIAVNPSTPIPSVSPTSPPIPTPIPTLGSLVTLSDSVRTEPTLLPTEAPVEPTATAAPTVTPTPLAIVSSSTAVNLRTGPGTDFAIVDQIVPGKSYDIVGRTGDSSWLLLCCLARETKAWVSASVVEVTGNLEAIDVVDNLPVPDSWLTYEDPTGTFTMRYPPQWDVEDRRAGVVTFGIGNYGGVVIQVISGAKRQDRDALQDLTESFLNGLPSSVQVREIEKGTSALFAGIFVLAVVHNSVYEIDTVWLVIESSVNDHRYSHTLAYRAGNSITENELRSLSMVLRSITAD